MNEDGREAEKALQTTGALLRLIVQKFGDGRSLTLESITQEHLRDVDIPQQVLINRVGLDIIITLVDHEKGDPGDAS